MSTAGTTDTDLIEIPNDLITVGIDKDGTPMAVPTEKAKANGGAAPEPEPKKTVTLAEFAAQQEIAAAERKAREEAEAQTKAEREKHAETEKKLGTTTKQALNAHFEKTLETWRSADSTHRQLASGVAQCDALSASKEAEYAAALEAGDHKRAASVQTEIARIAADRAMLDNGRMQAEGVVYQAKADYDTAVATYRANAADPKPDAEPVVAEPKPTQQPQQIQSADDLIAASPVATRPWLKDHREYATPGSKEFRRLARFVDEYLEDKGDNRDALNTPEFVKALDERFFPEVSVSEPETKPTVATPAPQEQRRAMPAAPVSRGGEVFSSANLNAASVRLPPDVVAFCKQAGLDQTKYAIQCVQDIRTGKLPKEWLDPNFDRGIR